MKVTELLNLDEIKLIRNAGLFEIRDICYNSRTVEKNDVFVAVNGFKTDGHHYISDALKKGASAVILENEAYIPHKEDVWIFSTEDARKALAAVSSLFYGNPAEKMFSIGVTGTNGKTSVTTYLYDYYFNFKGMTTGLTGTIKNIISGAEYPAKNTTLESKDLQALFFKMKKARVKYLICEVSSHALALKRIYGVQFDMALFTNLTRDHLDFHKSMERYYRSKKILFTQNLKRNGLAVINIDDPYGQRLIKSVHNAYSVSMMMPKANFYIDQIQYSINETTFSLTVQGETKLPIVTRLLGKFNVINVLLLFAALYLNGEKAEDIVKFIGTLTPVKGRFQNIKTQNNIHIIIDYAHTPDALENILKATRAFRRGKLITVFGAGGDRDRGKRPLMGEAASRYSDYVIVTNDNPRSEDPQKIADDVIKGIRTAHTVILDRKDAIINALDRARPEDWVILAGKGHEDYQIIGDKKIHFSDEETVVNYLRSRNLL
ncbi:MAG TPA: UDP-N-acetylmuramoyl-L-alanyl-D-glutamate--2,6-diaminopimelate ligase [Bacteroidetes bacterium]|nr:UDP-N-acetylmuramoyl-L-alanyl-D-glutamate--2,6-diaminopimelate ligase [Bacteroidota bacterium]